jgi:hypothetical protein
MVEVGGVDVMRRGTASVRPGWARMWRMRRSICFVASSGASGSAEVGREPRLVRRARRRPAPEDDQIHLDGGGLDPARADTPVNRRTITAPATGWLCDLWSAVAYGSSTPGPEVSPSERSDGDRHQDQARLGSCSEYCSQ